MPTAALELHSDIDAPSHARAALLGLDLDPDVCFDAQIVISELVTSGVLDGAGEDICLEVEALEPLHVRGHVEGASHRLTGGLARTLVDAVATGWGTDDEAGRMWFEIHRADGAG